MPLIVDTYNVLHVTGVLPPELAGLDVSGLAELVARSAFGRATTWLVCDGVRGDGEGIRRSRRPQGEGAGRSGTPPGRPWRGSGPRGDDPESNGPAAARVIVCYAGAASTADAQIGRMIAASSTPRRLTVVSSDHEVRRMAEKRRCRWLSSQEFLARLAKDAAGGASRRQRTRKPPAPLSQRETERWVRDFDLDPAMLEIPSSDGARADAGTASTPQLDGEHGEARATQAASPRGEGDQPRARRRALEDAESLDDVDPAELERFDMNDWLPMDEGRAAPRPVSADGERSARRQGGQARGKRTLRRRDQDGGRRGRS